MGSTYGGSKASVTYTGPGDVVSGATAWYGLRAYNAAYATAKSKAVNLRRASDNATCDFDVATTGALGVSDSGCGTGVGLSLAAFATQDATCTGTIASTTMTCASASSTPHAGSTLTGTGITQPSYIVSCGTFTGGAGTCTLNAAQTVSVGETITMTYGLYVTEAYDQSGNGHNIIQSTAGNQPQLLTSSGPYPNSLITNTMSFNGTSQYLIGSSAGNFPFPTTNITWSLTSTTSGNRPILEAEGAPWYLVEMSSTDLTITFPGVASYAFNTLPFTAATWAFVASTISGNGGSGIGYRQNVGSSISNQTLSVGTAGTVGSTTLFLGSDHFPEYWSGYIAEMGIWGSVLNSTQISNLEANH